MKPALPGSTVTPGVEQLELITEVIAGVAAHRRLSADDAQEFRQATYLRLLERNCDVFARHSGASSLKTFLTVVVNRMFIDWQRARFGKWRPSACARRLGPYAVVLDSLVGRDGHSPQEAVRVVSGMPGAPDESLLERIVETLPRRARRRHVYVYDLERHPSVPFADPLEARLEAAAAHRLRTAVRDAMASLSDEDRRLFEARYLRRQKVRTLATALQINAPQLYRRSARVLRRVRFKLTRAGFCAATKPSHVSRPRGR